MISGALFLSKDNSLTKIYGKYIFRITIAFILWSSLSALKYYIETGDSLNTLLRFIKGHGGHLWFLYMIVGLYMIIPFLKKIVESEFLTKYYLALSFIFAFMIPEAVTVIMLFSEKYAVFIRNYFGGFQMHFVLGYTGYFILGYFMNNAVISKKAERSIYALGILGFVSSIIFSVFASLITNKTRRADTMTASILFETIALFVFFKLHYPKNDKLINLFRILSKYTFGAYLVHGAVIAAINNFLPAPLLFNPLFSVPLIAVITFIISFIISGILNNIPVLRKYIV